jgi:hypothetical protein
LYQGSGSCQGSPTKVTNVPACLVLASVGTQAVVCSGPGGAPIDSNSTSIIIGVVVGGLVAVIAIVAGLVYYRRQRRPQEETPYLQHAVQ